MADEGKKPIESHLNVTASEAVRKPVIEKTGEDGGIRNKRKVWVAKGVRRKQVFPKKFLQAPEENQCTVLREPSGFRDHRTAQSEDPHSSRT